MAAALSRGQEVVVQGIDYTVVRVVYKTYKDVKAQKKAINLEAKKVAAMNKSLPSIKKDEMKKINDRKITDISKKKPLKLPSINPNFKR